MYMRAWKHLTVFGIGIKGHRIMYSWYIVFGFTCIVKIVCLSVSSVSEVVK